MAGEILGLTPKLRGVLRAIDSRTQGPEGCVAAADGSSKPGACTTGYPPGESAGT